MITIAVFLLFAAAGLFAFAAIAGTVHRYGPAVLRLREALRGYSEDQELRFSVTELRVALAKEARILRPDFGASPRLRPQQAQLRAAA